MDVVDGPLPAGQLHQVQLILLLLCLLAEEFIKLDGVWPADWLTGGGGGGGGGGMLATEDRSSSGVAGRSSSDRTTSVRRCRSAAYA